MVLNLPDFMIIVVENVSEERYRNFVNFFNSNYRVSIHKI